MKRLGFASALWVLSALAAAQSPDGMFAQGAVAAVLDGWHVAAASADEAKYFAAFTPDAVFLGTDDTERWTRDEFYKFAHPYFAKGKAWTYKPAQRWISFSPDGRVAWFDELLDSEHLGRCRGSGVLVSTPGGWKIAQYNLSIPIPNDLADEFTRKIALRAKPANSEKPQSEKRKS